MQGNERNINRLDKGFEDRSWAEMQKILDVEMPQTAAEEKGKKRFLLLFLFLFVGFGSGVGTMFYFNQQDNLEIPIPVEVQKKELAETSNVLEIDQLPNSKQIITNDIEKSKNFEDKNSKADSKNYSTKTDETIQGKKINDKLLIVAKQESASRQLVELASNSEDNSKDPNEKQDFTHQLNSELNKTAVIDFLPSKFSLLDEQPNATPKMKLLATPKTKKWSFGILAANFSNNNKIAAGFTAGGKATFDLNRRFTLGGGLQYSIYTGFKEGDGLKSRNADEVFSNQNIPGQGQDTTSSNGFESTIILDNFAIPQSSNSELPISNLQYIEMPIEIAYRFSRKFQLNLGVKGGYLIGSKTDGNVDFDNNLSSTVRSSEKDNEQIFRKSLNRFDVAASLGIGFYPSKKVGIDLRYNHGFVDITKNDSWPNNQTYNNKNLQLSVLYFFGKK